MCRDTSYHCLIHSFIFFMSLHPPPSCHFIHTAPTAFRYCLELQVGSDNIVVERQNLHTESPSFCAATPSQTASRFTTSCVFVNVSSNTIFLSFNISQPIVVVWSLLVKGFFHCTFQCENSENINRDTFLLQSDEQHQMKQTTVIEAHRPLLYQCPFEGECIICMLTLQCSKQKGT